MKLRVGSAEEGFYASMSYIAIKVGLAIVSSHSVDFLHRVDLGDVEFVGANSYHRSYWGDDQKRINRLEPWKVHYKCIGFQRGGRIYHIFHGVREHIVADHPIGNDILLEDLCIWISMVPETRTDVPFLLEI